jgi:hypothetical protein
MFLTRQVAERFMVEQNSPRHQALDRDVILITLKFERHLARSICVFRDNCIRN